MQRGTVIPGNDDSPRIKVREYDGDLFLIQDTETGEESISLTDVQVKALRYWLNAWHDDDERIQSRRGHRI